MKYSRFDEITKAIDQFILDKSLKKKDKKAPAKKSELETKVEMEKVSEETDKRKVSDTIDKKTKKKEDKDSDKKVKKSKKDHRKSQGKAITYSSQEEQLLAENFYQSNLDYNQLFSYSLNPNAKDAGAVYELGKIATAYSDVEDEQISAVEASETMREVQFAALLGAKTEVSYIKRKKMANWAMFNSAELRLFENMYGLTRDIDYAKTF